MLQPESGSFSRESVLQRVVPTAEYLAALNFYSYKFSQGDPEEFQILIFNYLKSLHPTWNISDSVWEKAHSLVSDQIQTGLPKSIAQGEHRPAPRFSTPEMRQFEIDTNFDSMRSSFELEGIDGSSTISAIGSLMIDKDTKYLVQGRVPQFIQHGLLEQPTGFSEYDFMFKDVVEAIKNPKGHRFKGDPRSRGEHLMKLLDKYHPETAKKVSGLF